MSHSDLVPGTYVRHPTQPDWGLGQVQSAVGNRITVNFENVGKILVNADVIALTPVDLDRSDPGEKESHDAPRQGRLRR